MILATTSQKNILGQMELLDSFNTLLYVSNVTQMNSIDIVLKKLGSYNDNECELLNKMLMDANLDGKISIGIKKLIYMSEMASQDEDKVAKLFSNIHDEGLVFKVQ